MATDKTDKLEIRVEPRTVIGKNVRFLRRQGVIPANVYGHGIASYPIQAEAKELGEVLKSAGTSKLIGLRLPREREPRRVLVREVRRDPRTGRLLHVDFYQVRMTEKLKAEVHLAYVGESPVAKAGEGILMHSLTAVDVECLPSDLPSSIQVDVSALESVDDAIHVKDLTVPPGVTVLNDPEELVAKVAAVRVEREEVVEKPEVPPVEEVPEAAEEEVE